MAEAEVIFSLNGVQTKIKCNKEDIMKDICKKFSIAKKVDTTNMLLLYKGNKINPFISFNELANDEDRAKNIINISCIQINRKNTIHRRSVKTKRESINNLRKSNIHKKSSKKIEINDIPKIEKTNKQDYNNKTMIVTNTLRKSLLKKEKELNENVKNENIKNENIKNEHVKKENTNDNNFYNFNKMFNYNDFFRAGSFQINLTEQSKTNMLNEYCSEDINLRNSEMINPTKKTEENDKDLSNEKILESEFDGFEKKFHLINNKINDLINILNQISENINTFVEITFDKINNQEVVTQDTQIINNFKDIINNYQKFIDEINTSILNNKVSKASELFNKLINMYKESNKDIIKYKINENDKKIKIFGQKFVVNNWDNCRIIYKDQECKLCEYIELENLKNRDKILEIKLKVVRELKDISYMFADCESLISVSRTLSWKTDSITIMMGLFAGCTSLQVLPDLSLIDTSKITNMRGIFLGCQSLKSLPDISKWNTEKVTYMQHLFDNCSSLTSIPDISKWNTENVTNMQYMFRNCSSLKTLPDFSKWNMRKVSNIQGIFEGCVKLITMPNIENWQLANNAITTNMINKCKRTFKNSNKFKKFITYNNFNKKK